MKRQGNRTPVLGVILVTILACLFGAISIAHGSAGPSKTRKGQGSIAQRHAVARRGHRHRHTQRPERAPTPAPIQVSAPAPVPTDGAGPTRQAAPAGYKLFFEDEFDRGSVANFVQGADNTGRSSVDKASGTAAVTLPAGAREPREELSINRSNQHFTEGMRFVLELERWLAPGTVPASPGNHFTIAQFKGLEGRFPMVSEEYGNYNRQGNGLYVQDKNRATNANFRIADYALGAWHTDRIFVTVSKARRGAYTLSIDGRQAAAASGINTLEPVDSFGFIKIGAYGQPAGRAVELKLRNIRLYVPA